MAQPWQREKWNPTSTVTGHTAWYLAQAKEKGIRIISVDPRYTDTTAIFADQWIPILPGTDTAMLISMAYVIIERSLHDQAFLEAYTTGFDQFKAYVLGKEDGIAKTPAWAEAITGVITTIRTQDTRGHSPRKKYLPHQWYATRSVFLKSALLAMVRWLSSWHRWTKLIIIPRNLC